MWSTKRCRVTKPFASPRTQCCDAFIELNSTPFVVRLGRGSIPSWEFRHSKRSMSDLSVKAKHWCATTFPVSFAGIRLWHPILWFPFVWGQSWHIAMKYRGLTSNNVGWVISRTDAYRKKYTAGRNPSMMDMAAWDWWGKIPWASCNWLDFRFY